MVRSTARRSWLAALALLAASTAGAAPGGDRRNADVAAARQSIERAEFEKALGALDRAEAAGGLARTDVVQVLELRALVDLALGRRKDADDVLTTLATVDPNHRFAPETSPDLVTAFESARRRAPVPLEIAVTHEARASTLSLRARATRDALHLVKELQLGYRRNDQPWRWVAGGALDVSLRPSDRIEYAARAEGAAGVLSETPVQRFMAPAEPAERSRPFPWLYVGVGAAAVAGIVAGVLLLGSGSQRTQPTAPTLEAR